MTIGHRTWAIPEGWLPPRAGTRGRALESHEAACVLNAGDADAHLEIEVFFRDREPAGPYHVTVAARRTLHLRFNDLATPEPMPRGVEFAERVPLGRPRGDRSTPASTPATRRPRSMTTIAFSAAGEGASTVGEYILERLLDWGVRRVFGYPGDGINGIFERASASVQELEFVQVRHEEMAAFMACAHAKFTGEVGVCMATSGPGAIHLLNGLYDAKLDHQPVVAIVGQQRATALGGDYQQEVDLQTLFKDVAREYVQTMMVPAQARHARRPRHPHRARRADRDRVIVPNDVQEDDGRSRRHAHGTIHSGVGWSPPRVRPARRDLRRAADILNAGEQVAMLVGAGRPRRRATRSRTSPRCWAPASPRRCSARRCCRTTCRTSPAPSGCSARSRAGT